MARPKKEPRNDETIYLRIPTETGRRLDVLAEQLQRRTGLTVSRNDFVRKLLSEATENVVVVGKVTQEKKTGT
jgi:predicted DNA-binding protein